MRRLCFLLLICSGCAALKPVKVATLDNAVNETSGLVCFDSSLWTINDSGHRATLFELNTNGLVADSFFDYQTNNEDWEDLAVDSFFVYIADVGNNLQVRRGFVIDLISRYDFARRDSVIGSQEISFAVLPDQPDVFPKVRRRNYDLEALFVKKRYAYLISKNIKACGKSYGKLYRIPASQGAGAVQLVDSFRFNEPITGATYDEASNRLIVTGYLSCFVFDNFDENNFHATSPRRFRYNKLRQYEGIAFDNAKQKIYLANEKGFGKKSSLFEMPLSSLQGKEMKGGFGYAFRRFELTFILWVYNARIKSIARQKHLLKPKQEVHSNQPNER